MLNHFKEVRFLRVRDHQKEKLKWIQFQFLARNSLNFHKNFFLCAHLHTHKGIYIHFIATTKATHDVIIISRKQTGGRILKGNKNEAKKMEKCSRALQLREENFKEPKKNLFAKKWHKNFKKDVKSTKTQNVCMRMNEMYELGKKKSEGKKIMKKRKKKSEGKAYVLLSFQFFTRDFMRSRQKCRAVIEWIAEISLLMILKIFSHFWLPTWSFIQIWFLFCKFWVKTLIFFLLKQIFFMNFWFLRILKLSWDLVNRMMLCIAMNFTRLNFYSLRKLIELTRCKQASRKDVYESHFNICTISLAFFLRYTKDISEKHCRERVEKWVRKEERDLWRCQWGSLLCT